MVSTYLDSNEMATTQLGALGAAKNRKMAITKPIRHRALKIAPRASKHALGSPGDTLDLTASSPGGALYGFSSMPSILAASARKGSPGDMMSPCPADSSSA